MGGPGSIDGCTQELSFVTSNNDKNICEKAGKGPIKCRWSNNKHKYFECKAWNPSKRKTNEFLKLKVQGDKFAQLKRRLRIKQSKNSKLNTDPREKQEKRIHPKLTVLQETRALEQLENKTENEVIVQRKRNTCSSRDFSTFPSFSCFQSMAKRLPKDPDSAGQLRHKFVDKYGVTTEEQVVLEGCHSLGHIHFIDAPSKAFDQTPFKMDMAYIHDMEC